MASCRAVGFGLVRSQLAVVLVGPPWSGALGWSGRAVVAGSTLAGMS